MFQQNSYILKTGLCCSVLFIMYKVFQGITLRTPPDLIAVHSAEDKGIPDSGIPPSQIANHENLLNCQKHRLDHLHSQCQKLGFKNDTNLAEYSELKLKGFFGRLMTDDYHKVFMKALPKTGSKSWKTVLAQNSPYLTNSVDIINPNKWGDYAKHAHLYRLSDYCKKDILEMWKVYFSFVTVRHPLSRLESGFKHIQVRIGKYHKEMMRDPKLFWEKVAGKRFQEFVTMLVSKKESDINLHFKSAVYISQPCVLPWKFIVKTETIEQEMDYIINTKLSGKGGPVHINNGSDFTNEGSSQHIHKELLPLFSQLKNPRKSIEELLQKHFGMDMKLFGYSYVIEDGNVYATCDSFEKYGMCC